MRCPQCGSNYPEDHAICPKDGARLEPPQAGHAGLEDTRTVRPRRAEESKPRGFKAFDHPKLPVDRYEVLGTLGSGAMGSVYRARQKSIGREVAIKVLKMEHAEVKDLLPRFETEAKIISELRHPNTVKLLDYGETADGAPYLVTELLRGRPLDVVLKEGPVEAKRALKILRHVCAALNEAHGRNIVHRDLKPGNLFIEEIAGEEIVKVLDFGIAKVDRTSSFAERHMQDSPETAAGRIYGTPAYLSPEQAAGRPVDPRSDLYSLGVIAYELITGMRPFAGTLMEVMSAHLHASPPPFEELLGRPIADPRVERLVMRLLAKDPAERFGSAAEVASEIDGLLKDLGSEELRPVRRKPSALPALVGLSFLGVASAVWLIEHRAPAPSVEMLALTSSAAPSLAVATAAASPDTKAPPVAERTALGAPAEVHREKAPPRHSRGAVRLFAHRVISGGYDAGALRKTIGFMRPLLTSCFEQVESSPGAAVLDIRFVRKGDLTTVAVQPSSPRARAYEACIGPKATMFVWPEHSGPVGMASVKVGR